MFYKYLKINNRFLIVLIAFAHVVVFARVASADELRSYLLQVADKKVSGQYVREAFLKHMKKPFKENASKKVLIIGDSFAQDFFNSVQESGHWSDYQISTRYIPTRCQIFWGNQGERFIEAKDRVFCKNADSLSKAKVQVDKADIVVLAANWTTWSAGLLPETIKQLALKPQQKLVVIGRKSLGKVSIQKLLRLPKAKLSGLRNKVDAKQVAINKLLKKNLSPAVFIDQQQLICGADDSCAVFTPDMKLISFDGGHLTKDGASYVGKQLFQQSVLGKL